VTEEVIESRRVRSCPACRSKSLRVFTDTVTLPTQSCTLWPSRETAQACPKGEISLALCEQCGLLVNVAFDPAKLDYDEEYENSLHYSPLFREYAERFAGSLVERYDLRRKTVLEIGCGKGDFLRLLVNLGDNRGFGFDPAYEPDPDQQPDERLHFLKEYYSEAQDRVRPDLIIARQLLEHVDDPLAFLQGLRRTIGADTDVVVVLEVPNALDMLERIDVWDVIYEHPIYFTPQALDNVLRSAGFEVHEIRSVYEGLYLVAEAFPSEHAEVDRPPAGPELEGAVARFAEGYRDRLDRWRATLDDIHASGRRAVLWGAGARGDTFLNAVGTPEAIPLAVDINPRKWGKYLAGTGQPIVSPEALVDDPPDVVVIANEVYREEIAARLVEMGIAADITVA